MPQQSQQTKQSQQAEARLQLDRGLELVRKGKLSEAIAPLRRAAAEPTLAADAHFLLGVDYFESKEYAKAIEELKGLENSDHSERVLYMIEESSRRTGRVGEAKAAFHQLLTRYPDSAWTHYLMGTAYEDQQELEKAIGEYKQALQRDPEIPNANFAIGYLYWRQQNTEEARQWLKNETSKGCHGLANFYLGEIARAEHDNKTAEFQYRRTLECDPSSAEAHLRLGTVLGDQKHYTEAITELKQAIRLQPNESSAHYHLAEAYSQMGRKADAEAEYNKVRQIQAAKDNGIDVTKVSKQ
ncbi:MAG TPA: tetratricopeptide repeat protein [Bryobacteraceae bacterium]|nr:tetratricopeptide repeat protein [Bryobacteraceae bacterium]